MFNSGTTLNDWVYEQAMALLPTPDASAHKYRLGGEASNPAALKPEPAGVSLLPTPTARDHKDHLGARHAVTGKADLLPRAIGKMIDES